MRPLAQVWRTLIKRPAFAIPSIAGLAIAIAAAAAVFSAFSAIELGSLGFTSPARLVSVWLTDPLHSQQQVELSYGDWQAWRSARTQTADVALASSVNLDFTIFRGSTPEHVDGTVVTGNFFHVLGAKPLAGRFLADDDDRPSAPPRLVLSNRLWRTRFGGDFGIIGRQIRFGTGSATVIGIARADFGFPRDVEVWTALYPSWPDVEKSGTLGVFRGVARLASGVSTPQARVRLDAIRQNVKETDVGSPRFGTAVKPVRDEAFGMLRTAVAMLFGAALVLVLIACANAANLTLALHMERRPELAVRTALGADRGHVLRLLLAESGAMALWGGLGGLLLARFALGLLGRWAPPELAGLEQATLDWPILLFAAGLSTASVLLFGAWPAVLAARSGRTSMTAGMSSRSTSDRSQHRIRGLLIAAEVALSVTLVIGGVLLTRSFSNLSAIEPGFRPQNILTFRVTTELADQTPRRALYHAILQRLRSLPGVESAGAVLLRPLSGSVGWDTVYTVEGQAAIDQKSNPNGNYEAISPGYFGTMRIPMVAGRDFDDSDTERAPGAVIINQSTARRHWPRGNAIGTRLRLGQGAQSPWLTVIGIVADVRYREWESPRPDFYVPYTQRAQHRSDFVVKTRQDPWSLAEAVRQAVFDADKDQPISNVTTMGILVDRALSRARLSAYLIAALALSASGLAAMGIYGLLSYMVRQRTREIGVRTALGARPTQVAVEVTFDVFRFVAAGLAAGLAGGAIAARASQSQFFEVSPADPLTYLAVAFGLATIAILAAAIPAWRAGSIDPVAALRG